MNPSKTSGFSLIEFITAFAIVLLLVLLVVPGLGFFNKQETLQSQTQQIISTLRLAQNKTLASEGSRNFGVHFTSDQFILFASTSYDPSDPDNQISKVDSDLEITEISFTDQSVFFQRLTGQASSGGSLKVVNKNDTQQYEIIYVDISGRITNSSEGTASDQNRIKDSRHIHISFLGDTQTANQLVLYFPDDNFYKTINYQDYLNPARTEFFWTESFEVAGESQDLTIHSHALNSTQTDFCFHRDASQNTKGFTVSLDGQNIINFNNDGSFSKGTSLFVGDPERQ